ncbi:MAG TPA: sugar ABC transporter permease [Ktedonobacterales bacterium]|nr:sugar ABC transporter permease [Ktedonobacterales bacterium]
MVAVAKRAKLHRQAPPAPLAQSVAHALSRFMRRNGAGLLFLLPALVLFAFFVWYPIAYGFVLSFQDNSLFGGTGSWVGWRNFHRVLADPLFTFAWRNTIKYALYGLLFGYAIPIVLALAIDEVRFGKAYFRLAFYLPVIIPPLVTVFLWRYMYTPDGGLLNGLLNLIHVGPQPWLQSPATALQSLVVVTTWANAGGTMLIYLAALQSIPPELYEAAELDGAGIFSRIWHITLPQIRGVMLIMLILQIIATFQIFTEPFTLTDGGPVNATTTIMLLIYNYAFQNADLGMASALSVMLFLVLVTFSLGYFALTRRLWVGGE